MDGSITVKDLADRVYAIYPTKAKTAMSSFRNCLHYDEQGVNLAYLNKDTILPMRIAMQGVRFRVPIDRHAEKDSSRRKIVTIGVREMPIARSLLAKHPVGKSDELSAESASKFSSPPTTSPAPTINRRAKPTKPAQAD